MCIKDTQLRVKKWKEEVDFLGDRAEIVVSVWPTQGQYRIEIARALGTRFLVLFFSLFFLNKFSHCFSGPVANFFLRLG